MRKRPKSQCTLCHETKLLCDSHLIAAGFYRIIRGPGPHSKNPNPIYLRDEEAFSSSRPIIDYVLCEECERRMRDRGEGWVLMNCLQSDFTFKLRDALLRTQPALTVGGQQFYVTTGIPDIDNGMLHYFALSVFWRAAAHTWKCQGKRGDVNLDFGNRLEPLRLFLLDKGPFPDNVSLVVRLLTMPDERLKMIWLPETFNSDGFHYHQFAIPGVAFSLLVGGRIPSDDLSLCSFRSRERFIRVAHEGDQMMLEDVQQRVMRVRSRIR